MRFFIETVAGKVVSRISSNNPDADVPEGHVEVDEVTFIATPLTPLPVTRLSRRDFYRLFTKAQVLAVGVARTSNADLAYWFTLLEQDPTVDLRHPDTGEAIDALVAANILTPDDKTRVLAGGRPGK